MFNPFGLFSKEQKIPLQQHHYDQAIRLNALHPEMETEKLAEVWVTETVDPYPEYLPDVLPYRRAAIESHTQALQAVRSGNVRVVHDGARKGDPLCESCPLEEAYKKKDYPAMLVFKHRTNKRKNYY